MYTSDKILIVSFLYIHVFIYDLCPSFYTHFLPFSCLITFTYAPSKHSVIFFSSLYIALCLSDFFFIYTHIYIHTYTHSFSLLSRYNITSTIHTLLLLLQSTDWTHVLFIPTTVLKLNIVYYRLTSIPMFMYAHCANRKNISTHSYHLTRVVH
jgi:hypothetical protein